MSYVYGAVALIIGILVLVLRIQGSRLHQAQVDLLRARLEMTDEQDKRSVYQAYEAYNKAYQAYKQAVKEGRG